MSVCMYVSVLFVFTFFQGNCLKPRHSNSLECQPDKNITKVSYIMTK